jgi:hypothetical protein
MNSLSNSKQPVYVDPSYSIFTKHLVAGRTLDSSAALRIPISSRGLLFSNPSIHSQTGGQLQRPFTVTKAPYGTSADGLGAISGTSLCSGLPHFAFGAARSFGGSGRFKASRIHRTVGAVHSFSSGSFNAPNIHRQPSFLRPFHDFEGSGRFHRQDFFHTRSTALDLVVGF